MLKKMVDKRTQASDNRGTQDCEKDNNMAMPMKGNSITFRVEICVEADGDSFHAYCPALKGVHVDGNTEEGALSNAKKAIELYIRSLINHNDPIPLEVVEASERNGKTTLVCPPQQRHKEEVRVAM